MRRLQQVSRRKNAEPGMAQETAWGKRGCLHERGLERSAGKMLRINTATAGMHCKKCKAGEEVSWVARLRGRAQAGVNLVTHKHR